MDTIIHLSELVGDIEDIVLEWGTSVVLYVDKGKYWITFQYQLKGWTYHAVMNYSYIF